MNELVIRLALSAALIMLTGFVPASASGCGERAILAEPAAISFVHEVGLAPGASSRGGAGIRAAIPAERDPDIDGEGIEEWDQDQWDPGTGGFHLGPIIMMLAIAAVAGLLSLGLVILIIVLIVRAERGRRLLQERMRAERMAAEGTQRGSDGSGSASKIETAAAPESGERFSPCRSCGAELGSEDEFCRQCGARVDSKQRSTDG